MILDAFKLDGKVAVVTGAGRGIGKAYALALAEAGAALAPGDIPPADGTCPGSPAPAPTPTAHPLPPAPPQPAGQQPPPRVRHHRRRQRAVRQHVVADAQLLVSQQRQGPFVDALVVAADEDEVPLPRQPAGRLLTERRALRRHGDHARPRPAEAFHRLEERLGLHQHPGAPAIGVVVQRAPRVVREVAQVHRVELRRAHRRRAPHDAFAEEAFEHPREHRQHVDAQGHRAALPAWPYAWAAAAALRACLTSEATVSESCAPWLVQ